MKQLKKTGTKTNAKATTDDTLLTKLTSFHNRLSSRVGNILTEVTSKVAEVIHDVSQIDDVRRPYRWSKDDEMRLNKLNSEAKTLQTPPKWTWAAKEGTS